jgi:hypothetical protein
MSTHVETRRGAPSPFTRQTVATGQVEPLSPVDQHDNLVQDAERRDPRRPNWTCDNGGEELIAQVAPVARPNTERRAKHAPCGAHADERD